MKIFCRDAARRVPIIIFLGLFFLVNAGARAAESENPPAAKEKADDLSKPVALVNGVKIPGLALKKAVEGRIPATGHLSISEKRFAEIRAEELNGLIIEEVLLREARRLKVKVPPELIEAEMKKIEARFPSEEKYQANLKAKDLTPEEVRTGVERYLAIRQLTDQEVRSRIIVSDEQMKSYYEGHWEQFKMPEQVRLRILLIGVDPSGLSADWEKGRQRAQELADRAKKGEDFPGLVRQFSDETEWKAKGGDTGLLHQGRLPYSELEPVAYAKGAGSISDPVRTLYGYVVFKMEERKPAQQLEFKDLNKDLLRKEMQESVTEAKLKEW
ncbi:MAG: peptidylprolyl isomerase, partial [Nitrospirae bacterium]|nr:peptidylprolyl isomerase [Nitrospirota bacterium]